MFKVTDIRKVATKYGESTVIDLDDAKALFLPKRVVKLFKADENLFDSMKEAIKEKKLFVKYLDTAVYNNIKCNNIEFCEA